MKILPFWGIFLPWSAENSDLDLNTTLNMNMKSSSQKVWTNMISLIRCKISSWLHYLGDWLWRLLVCMVEFPACKWGEEKELVRKWKITCTNQPFRQKKEKEKGRKTQSARCHICLNCLNSLRSCKHTVGNLINSSLSSVALRSNR